MTDKEVIEKLVGEHIGGSGIFLVAVKVSANGKITVLIDRKERITIEECADLSRFIEKHLDREVEDYELQVSSPGLDMPFLVIQQYYKNEGRQIEVTATDGQKYKGILKNVTSGGFELETGAKDKPGSKGKPAEIKDISFNYEQVKSAREIVTFK
jgi:ribosome maturation factor RimP